MEAVGAVASIIGIVGSGAKLSIAVFDFASTIGSAGAEVRAIGTEISLFCSVLKQLERTLAKAKNRRYSISAIEATQEILDATRGVFEEIEDIVNGFQKNKRRSEEQSIDLAARIKWTLGKRSKIQRHRAMLESCKITLHIMLTTLDFARKLSSRRLVIFESNKTALLTLYRISTVKTDLEDEREEMVTQSLVYAQRLAVDNLEKVERDEQQDGMDMDGQPKTIDKPPPYMRRRAITGERDFDRRKSVWLHDLLSDNTLDPDTRRLSSESSNSKIHQLPQFLWKWTDQGKHWNDMHRIPQVFSSDNVDFQDSMGRIPRNGTPLLSPSSTEAPTPRDPLSPPNDPGYFPMAPRTPNSLSKGRQPSRKLPPPPLPLVQKLAEPGTPSSTFLPSPSPSPMNATFRAELKPITPHPSIPRLPRSPTTPFPATSSRDRNLAADPSTPTTYKNMNMRIERDKTCQSILPEIMKMYGLEEDPMNYCLFLKTDDHMRQLDDSEMPLKLLKSYKYKGKHPEFQLMKVSKHPTPTDREAWV